MKSLQKLSGATKKFVNGCIQKTDSNYAFILRGQNLTIATGWPRKKWAELWVYLATLSKVLL